MKKIALIAAGVASLAIGYSAQAQLVLSGTATWVNTGSTGPTPDLSITYDVFDNLGVYSYEYFLSDPSSNPVLGFSVDANYVLAVGQGGSDSSGVVSWSDPTFTTSGGIDTYEELSFTSDFAPTLGGGSAYDGVPSVAWSATATGDSGVPDSLIAVPVPETSTVVAGALMLLPLGIGAIRAIRKERTA